MHFNIFIRSYFSCLKIFICLTKIILSPPIYNYHQLGYFPSSNKFHSASLQKHEIKNPQTKKESRFSSPPWIPLAVSYRVVKFRNFQSNVPGTLRTPCTLPGAELLQSKPRLLTLEHTQLAKEMLRRATCPLARFVRQSLRRTQESLIARDFAG